MKRVAGIVVFLIGALPWAIAGAQGQLVTYATEGAVHMRWNAPLGEPFDGFHVERQEADAGPWVRLTEEPVQPISDVERIRSLLGINAESYLTFFDANIATIDDAAFDRVMSDEFARGLIQLFSVRYPAMGEILGEVFRDRDMRPGQSFNYRVLLIRDGQENPYARSQSPVTHGQPDRIPVPEGFRGNGIENAAELDWDYDQALSRAGIVVGFRLYRSQSPSGPFLPLRGDTYIPTAVDGQLPEYLYVDRFLTNGTPYWYRITGVNVLGFESALSKSIKVIPKDMTPPATPTGLQGQLMGENVFLRWLPVDDADLEGYRVYRSLEAADGPYGQLWPGTDEPTVPMLSYLDTDVSEGALVFYFVVAVDTSGNESLPSEAIQVFRPDVTPPARVQGVEAIGIGEGENPGIRITWEPNDEDDLLGYLVQSTTRIEGEGAEARVTTDFYAENAEPLTVTEFLDPVSIRSQSRHAYRVIAVDEAFNRSEPSEVAIARMPDIVPPSIPSIQYVRQDGDVVTIGWLVNVDEDLAGYHLYRAEANGGFAMITGEPISSELTSYEDTPPGRDRIYRYYLTAIDEAGNESEPSTTLSVQVLDVAVPDAPAIERLEAEEAGFHLFWTPDRSAEIQNVTIYRQTGNSNRAIIVADVDRDRSDFVDTDVESDVTYTYFLRVFDDEGNVSDPGPSLTGTYTTED